MKKLNKYIPPSTYIIECKGAENIMGVMISIVKDNEKLTDGESWDTNEYLGSWENIWNE